MAKNRAITSEQAGRAGGLGHKGEEVEEQACDVKAPGRASQRGLDSRPRLRVGDIPRRSNSARMRIAEVEEQ